MRRCAPGKRRQDDPDRQPATMTFRRGQHARLPHLAGVTATLFLSQNHSLSDLPDFGSARGPGRGMREKELAVSALAGKATVRSVHQ
jgi:hypothetical protein